MIIMIIIFKHYLIVPGYYDTSRVFITRPVILQMLRLALVAAVIVQALALPFDLTLDNEWELFKVAYKKNYGEEESNRSYNVNSIQYS